MIKWKKYRQSQYTIDILKFKYDIGGTSCVFLIRTINYTVMFTLILTIIILRKINIIWNVPYYRCLYVSGIPYAFHLSGVGMGVILLALVAIVTDYSLVLMLRSAHISGSFSYQALMKSAFGRYGFIVLSLLQFIYPFIGKSENI